ncbi:hypothetical protein APSETT445_008897 [Aspergillus pseudonomiae]
MQIAASLNDGKVHLLLAATGSVATIKLPLIIAAFADHPNISIRVILTKAAAEFLRAQSEEQPSVESLSSLPNVDSVLHDEDEWTEPWTRGSDILHITLRRWAHLLVIAPLSANSLAKVVHGMSDNLLTSVVRAWDTTGLIDGRKKRILVAPAMNTAMWMHPVTAQQMRVLEEDWGVKEINGNVQGWFEVLRPIEKSLACGDVGSGGMMEWREIVKIIKITAIDRVIVAGKTKEDDTDWIVNELPSWQHAIYAVDDPEAPLHVAKNKGKEASVYLQYIIDNYDDLPSTIVFLHSHRDGYPRAWHTEFSDHSNVRTARMLQTDFVQRNGYANLRCNPNPGCPDEIRPFRGLSDEEHLPEQVFPEVWQTFFNNTDVPEVIATPCCAQFAVSRTQVLQRPLSNYVRYHQWLMETELPDDVSGRVMEYMWHIIFGQDPV